MNIARNKKMRTKRVYLIVNSIMLIAVMMIFASFIIGLFNMTAPIHSTIGYIIIGLFSGSLPVMLIAVLIAHVYID